MEEMIAPSGRVFCELDRRCLTLMAQFGTLRWTDEPFILKSRIPSHIYFYGREDVTDNPALSRVCGELITRHLIPLMEGDARKPILIGVPTAANGFAASVMTSTDTSPGDHSFAYRVMREKLKEGHGAKGHQGTWVNGAPNSEEHWYATIENVVTSGKSLLDALVRMGSDGYPVMPMPHLVFLDREQGGVKMLRDKGHNIVTLFGLLDTVWAFKELGIKGWDADRVAAVEAEIKAHQVT